LILDCAASDERRYASTSADRKSRLPRVQVSLSRRAQVTVVNLVLRRVMPNMESSPAGRLEAFPDLSRKNPHD
jgi:hypothetical protein